MLFSLSVEIVVAFSSSGYTGCAGKRAQCAAADRGKQAKEKEWLLSNLESKPVLNFSYDF